MSSNSDTVVVPQWKFKSDKLFDVQFGTTTRSPTRSTSSSATAARASSGAQYPPSAEGSQSRSGRMTATAEGEDTSTPGEGTEVELTLPRESHDVRVS